MIPTPDPSMLATPAPDGRELAVTGMLSGGSLVGTFVAMAQSFPAQGAIAVAGIVGSVTIQIVRMTTDNRIAKLTSDNLHYQSAARAADAREATHLARIAALVAQVDGLHTKLDRVTTAILAHSGAMSPEMHKAIAEASAIPTSPASPVPPIKPPDAPPTAIDSTDPRVMP